MIKTKFNSDWEFWNDRTPDKREKVQLPHDAMLTENRLPGIKNGVATGFYPGGKYHYVKKFFADKEMQNKCVMIEFEGVYMKASVLLNGELVGGHIYGYTTFFVDLTDKLQIDEYNLIEVIADNTQTPNSRWYSGSGIYRDVWILTGEKKHISENGVKLITSSLDATLEATVGIEGEGWENCSLSIGVYLDGERKAYKSEVPCINSGDKAWGEFTVSTMINIPDPCLWSEDNPVLYEVEIVLYEGNHILDTYRTKTGLRTLSWNAETGLCVNGVPIKLRGGCIHHDNGILGAVSLKKAELRRGRILKNTGFNAVRYSHNPAGQAFLESCDELGIYVMVEAFDQWKGKQSDYDYGLYFEKEWEKDLTAMIQMSVNHPSVIIYSYGNEISDVGTEEGPALCKMLNDCCHRLDSSRPTTNCINPVVAAMGSVSKSKTSPEDVVNPYEETVGSAAAGSLLANMIVTVAPFMSRVFGEPRKQEKKMAECYKNMDIVGHNYSDRCYEPHHQWAPDRIMVGSETYPPDLARNWAYIKNAPFVIGDFMWTAWDYLGEAGIGVPVYGSKRGGFNRPYPCVFAGCGAIDSTGIVETPGYYAAVIWERYKKPYIAVRPVNHSNEAYFFGMWRGTDAVNSWSWTNQEGKLAQIEVYSQGDSVELFKDGVSLGKKKLKDFRAVYATTYEPGKLLAVSYDEMNNKLEESTLSSAKAALQLNVRFEENNISADGEDFVYGFVELTDDTGVLKLMCDRRVCLEVNGAGELIALGSANPYTTDSFLGNEYETYNGRLCFIIKSNGESGNIMVTARAGELKATGNLFAI